QDEFAQAVDLVLPPGATRLRIGLERFPDYRRERLFGRPAFEYALAAAAIHPHHAHTLGGEERAAGPVIARFLHELLEDRRGDPPALGPSAKTARLVVAEVDPGDDVRRAADEPYVRGPRGGAGLAEQRHSQIAQRDRGAA